MNTKIIQPEKVPMELGNPENIGDMLVTEDLKHLYFIREVGDNNSDIINAEVIHIILEGLKGSPIMIRRNASL